MIEPGKTYRIKGTSKYFKEKYDTSNPEIRIEDTARVVFGKPWYLMNGNPAAMLFAIRAGAEGLEAMDEKVYYGKIQGLGELVCESELEELT